MRQLPVARFECMAWPSLRVREDRLRFTNGVLEVFSEADAAVVRRCHGYGCQVLEVPITAPSPEIATSGGARQGMRTTATVEPPLVPAPKEAPKDPLKEAPPTRSAIKRAPNKRTLLEMVADAGLTSESGATNRELRALLLAHYYPEE